MGRWHLENLPVASGFCWCEEWALAGRELRRVDCGDSSVQASCLRWQVVVMRVLSDGGLLSLVQVGGGGVCSSSWALQLSAVRRTYSGGASCSSGQERWGFRRQRHVFYWVLGHINMGMRCEPSGYAGVMGVMVIMMG